MLVLPLLAAQPQRTWVVQPPSSDSVRNTSRAIT